MLVLARRWNERIIITCPDGTEIVVALVDIRDDGTKVRLGISAPREYIIDREEIHVSKMREKIRMHIDREIQKKERP